MLKIKTIPILILALAMATGAQAQGGKKPTGYKAKTTRTAVQEKPAEEILYEEMLPSTAKIIIIDSVVTDKTAFLDSIPLGREAGTVRTYNDFFNTDRQPEGFVYMNEFGNKKYYTETDGTGEMRLYTSDRLGGKWSVATIVSDFGGEFEDINCPFMMADGVTLYFAAKSKHGLGGYDIYVTRYDADAAKFYKPENIGLPYNSSSNDYYYIADDFNSLGWLVTDRNQPEGKVCIYTFIPSASRETYNGDIDDNELDGLARITNIKATWGNGAERKKALARLEQLRERQKADNSKEPGMVFVINDNLTYHSIDDFKSPTNRQKYAALLNKISMLKDLTARTEDMRDRYACATVSERQSMKEDILDAEKQMEKLQTEIDAEEKSIRNAENMSL